jgi:chemotaxis signal transduction protein
VFGKSERIGAKDKKGEIEGIDQLLVFTVGTSAYAIEVRYLRRIVKEKEIINLPNEPEFIPGIVHLHFGVARVIDIRKIIPLDIPLGPSARIVIFSSHAHDTAYYALIVDEIIGFVELPHGRVTSTVTTARYITNNFMLGWFMLGIEEFKKQISRKATDGDDKVTWIDFEEMISAIINHGDSDEIIFRLTALFNPDYLLSEEYQEILRTKENKKRGLRESSITSKK